MEEIQCRRVLVQNDPYFSHGIARERNPTFLSIDIFLRHISNERKGKENKKKKKKLHEGKKKEIKMDRYFQNVLI